MKNFKNLGDDYQDRFQLPLGEEQKISSSFGFLRHIGNVVEHFIGRATDVMITIAGGEKRKGNFRTPPNKGGGSSSRGDLPTPPNRPL